MKSARQGLSVPVRISVGRTNSPISRMQTPSKIGASDWAVQRAFPPSDRFKGKTLHVCTPRTTLAMRPLLSFCRNGCSIDSLRGLSNEDVRGARYTCLTYNMSKYV